MGESRYLTGFNIGAGLIRDSCTMVFAFLYSQCNETVRRQNFRLEGTWASAT